MALSQEIAWGDGSGDKIYISGNASEGNQTLSISSDANTGAARTKTLTFSASGVSPVTLTVNQEAGATIPLWFELESATTTQDYDTEVKLFDSPKSFTILCDATFNNYSWNAWTQGVFGIATNRLFRFGSLTSGEDYRDNSLNTTANRYSAIIMNATTSGKRCSSCYSRSNASTRRKFAVRYDSSTRKIECYTGTSGTTTHWWIVPSDLSSENTLKLLIGNASGTIHRFKVYGGLVSIDDINDFINGS